MHAVIHQYKHPYIHIINIETYTQSGIHTTHTYIHFDTHIHASYISAFMHTYIQSYTHPI